MLYYLFLDFLNTQKIGQFQMKVTLLNGVNGKLNIFSTENLCNYLDTNFISQVDVSSVSQISENSFKEYLIE